MPFPIYVASLCWEWNFQKLQNMFFSVEGVCSLICWQEPVINLLFSGSQIESKRDEWKLIHLEVRNSENTQLSYSIQRLLRNAVLVLLKFLEILSFFIVQIVEQYCIRFGIPFFQEGNMTKMETCISGGTMKPQQNLKSVLSVWWISTQAMKLTTNT